MNKDLVGHVPERYLSAHPVTGASLCDLGSFFTSQSLFPL